MWSSKLAGGEGMAESNGEIKPVSPPLFLFLSKEGWMLKCGDKEAGPFADTGQIDAKETAEHLGCAWKDIVLRLMWASPFLNPKAKGMGGESELEEAQFTLKEIDKLSPALGLLKNNGSSELCVTIPLTVNVARKKKKGSDTEFMDEEILPVMVLSPSKKAYVANEENMRKLGVYYHSTIEIPPERWSVQGFNDWKLYNDKKNKLIVFYKLKEKFSYYLDWVEQGMDFYIPLWILASYFHVLFNQFPILGLGGPKWSGKSKVLKLLFLLCFNGKWSVGMTVSRMFRCAEALHSTIAFDEAEGLATDNDRKQAIRSMLNSSFDHGATVDLTDKNTLQGAEFQTYGPRALGAIQGFEDVLESRMILFIMLRTRGEKANRELEMDPKLAEWQEIRDELYVLLMNDWQNVRDCYVKLTGEDGVKLGLYGRDWQLWKPIIALTEWLGDEEIKKRVLELAKKKTAYRQSKDQFESDELVLLSILQETIQQNGSVTLTDIRCAMENSFDQVQNYMDNRYVGKLLERLNFTDKKKVKNSIIYHFKREDIVDRCNRYGVEITKQSNLVNLDT